MKKYEFTGDKKRVMDLETRALVEVKQIRAVRDFQEYEPRRRANGEMRTHLVKEGTVGGWIETEDNLSHEGNCWLAKDSFACGNAKISEDADISVHCIIMGDAIVKGKAIVSGLTTISGNASICGGYTLWGTSISQDAEIFDDTHVVGVKTMESSFTTFYRTNKNEIRVCECVNSLSLEEYLDEGIDKFGVDSKYTKIRIAAAELAKAHILG